MSDAAIMELNLPTGRNTIYRKYAYKYIQGDHLERSKVGGCYAIRKCVLRAV